MISFRLSIKRIIEIIHCKLSFNNRTILWISGYVNKEKKQGNAKAEVIVFCSKAM